jgi:hypothetical protein
VPGRRRRHRSRDGAQRHGVGLRALHNRLSVVIRLGHPPAQAPVAAISSAVLPASKRLPLCRIGGGDRQRYGARGMVLRILLGEAAPNSLRDTPSWMYILTRAKQLTTEDGRVQFLPADVTAGDCTPPKRHFRRGCSHVRSADHKNTAEGDLEYDYQSSAAPERRQAGDADGSTRRTARAIVGFQRDTDTSSIFGADLGGNS